MFKERSNQAKPWGKKGKERKRKRVRGRKEEKERKGERKKRKCLKRCCKLSNKTILLKILKTEIVIY